MCAWDRARGGGVLEPDLNEGVAEVVGHQDHDEDRNGNAKISNHPPQLDTHKTNVFVLERTEDDINMAANG